MPRVEVLTAVEDATHILLVERWASIEADDACRAFRADQGTSALGSILAAAPTLTRFGE